MDATVVVVEDDDVYREALGRALGREGFATSTFRGVAEVEAALSALEPDFAIVDLKLADGSGLDAIRSIVARSPRCRAIVLSGHGSVPAAVEAMRCGAVDFLAKPMSTSAIVAALRSAPPPAPTTRSDLTLDRLEREHIERVLAETGNNISEAARRLGVDRRTLQRKLQRLAS